MGDIFDEVYGANPAVQVATAPQAASGDIFDQVYASAQPSMFSSFTKGLVEAPGQTLDAVKSIPSGLSNLMSSIFSPKQSLEDGTLERTARGVGGLSAGVAGAGTGAIAGTPLAPFTLGLSVPVGAAIGGAAGLLGFDYLNQATGSDAPTTGAEDLNKLSEMTGQGITMSALGKVATKGASTISENAPKLAEILDRKSIGARQGDFAKSAKRGLVDSTTTGETSINLANSIEEVRKDGGFSGTRNPVKLLDKNTTVLDALDKDLTHLLETADIVNTSSPIIPKYSISEEWITTQPASEQAALKSALKEIKNAHNNVLDGSLSALQQEKRALYGKTYGESGAAKEALSKYVAADLKQAIETGVDDLVSQGKLPSDVAGTVKTLNEKSGVYQQVRPILTRGVVQSMTNDPIAKAANIGFTTGGIGAPTIAGGVLGGPLGSAIGAGIGLTGKALTTPTGQAATAATLRGMSKAATPFSKLLNTVFTPESIGALQSSGNISKKESNTLSLAAKVLSKPEILKSGATEMPKTPEFESKVSDIAKNLDTDPKFLMKAMAFETGGTFDSAVKNKAGSGATGLIQFMPSTAKDLTGADTKAAAVKILSDMTPTEQLDYVEKYLKPFKGKLNSIEDVYMAILYPKAVGKDSEYELFREGTKAYWQNRGLDTDKDGVITKREAANKVSNYNV